MREDHRDVRALAVRVEKLEAQNRRWKLMSVVIALVGISLVVAGAGRSETADSPVIRARTVEAQDFVLKDSRAIELVRAPQRKGNEGAWECLPHAKREGNGWTSGIAVF
jgi:hypothetical protein